MRWVEGDWITKTPFSPCSVTQNLKFTRRNVVLAQTDYAPFCYHKPHAGSAQEHMLPSALLEAREHQHVSPLPATKQEKQLHKTSIMWDPSHLQP